MHISIDYFVLFIYLYNFHSHAQVVAFFSSLQPASSILVAFLPKLLSFPQYNEKEEDMQNHPSTETVKGVGGMR